MAVKSWCIVCITHIIVFNVDTYATQISSGCTSTPYTPEELAVIHYIGAGYDIFKGSPDGGSWSHGGHDPGVHLTERILNIDDGNSPSQIELARHSCQNFQDYNLIYSPKSYQDRLRLFVEGDGSQQLPGDQYAFTLSADYNTVYHQTQLLHYVFQEFTTMCDLGDVSYNLYPVIEHVFPLSEIFATSMCNLPEQYSQNSYMEFLKTWGTHVIVKVSYGRRSTNRYKMKLNEYFKHLLERVSDDISEGGPLMGFQTSLKVDMNSFRYRPEFKEIAGVLYQQINSTGTNYYDINKMKIIPLDMLISKINKAFWPSFGNITGCVNKAFSIIQSWSSNLGRAISEYPVYSKANIPKDTDLAIPLTWPSGTYSLQSTTSGCPGEIKWFEGTRHEEMERQDPDSTWSRSHHFGGTLTSEVFQLKFCTKVQNSPTGFEVEWPSGDYCIYKYGPCPSGLQSGTVYIDDEDTANKNSYSGVLPDGIYNSDTTFYYCCRSDGTYLRPIWLPNTKPFYMFKYKSECQNVQGMAVSREYLLWDGEDGGALSHASGSHPALRDDRHYSIRVYYCYYTPVIALQSGSVIGK